MPATLKAGALNHWAREGTLPVVYENVGNPNILCRDSNLRDPAVVTRIPLQKCILPVLKNNDTKFGNF